MVRALAVGVVCLALVSCACGPNDDEGVVTGAQGPKPAVAAGKAALGESSRFVTCSVPRERLNKELPYGVYIDAWVSTAPTSVSLVVVARRGAPAGDLTQPYWEEQIVPRLYEWQLRDQDGDVTHRWYAHFLENRDLTRITSAKLPLSDLKRSYLLLKFEDIDGDGEREDVTYELDMRQYDWDGYNFGLERQSVG